jgi:hypothetical protein
MKLAFNNGILLPPANLHDLFPELLEFQSNRADRERWDLLTPRLPASFTSPMRFHLVSRERRSGASVGLTTVA